MHHEAFHAGFRLSDDRSRLDFGAAHAFLSRAYWSEDIPRALVEKAARHSAVVFGIYDERGDERGEGARPGALGRQVGYARVISDLATYAYLSDVYVLEDCRGLGLSKALMALVLSHPELQGLRRFALITRDAHGLYRQFGFGPMADPTRYMEWVAAPGIYKRSGAG